MKIKVVDGASYTLKNGQLLYEAYGEKNSVQLDALAKDFCIGKYGDGCGGGRVFVLDEDSVKAYDMQSDEVIVLLRGLNHTQSISKDGCMLKIDTDDEVINFNLSTMTKEKK